MSHSSLENGPIQLEESFDRVLLRPFIQECIQIHFAKKIYHFYYPCKDNQRPQRRETENCLYMRSRNP